MTMDRKTFLRGLGVGALGTLAAPSLLAASPLPHAVDALPGPLPLPAFDAASPEPFWAAVRSHYVLEPGLAYFNTGGLGPASKPVLDLFMRTMWAHQRLSDTGHDLFHEAREVLAKFFAVAPEEVCFTRNATEGNSIVAAGLRLAKGDEVIFESHAHPGGSFPWFNQQQLNGIVVKLFDPDPASPQGNLDRIRALITPRTKAIQVSHVTAPTGLVFDVAAIAKLAREHGAWFHIDGAQSAGMFPFGLRDTGCDSFATSGHKWIGGPHETGLLYVKRDRQDAVAPIEVGAYSGELPFLPGTLKYADSAVRYEYATRNAASVFALAEAIRLQEQVGRERIAAYSRSLADRLWAGLARIPDVEILTPAVPAMRASITTFRSPRVPYDKLFGALWGEYQCRCRPVSEQKLDALRVSTHLFNSTAQVDRLLDGIVTVLRQA